MKKVLKISGLVLLALIASILLIAAFVPDNYNVERSVVINKSKEVVYDYTRNLKNQNEFSVWSKIDPNMKVTYTGTDGTVGFVSAWDSPVKEAGKGEQEIIKIDEGKRIDYEIRFLKPMKSTDNAFLEFSEVNDSSTSVRWGFYGNMKYPMNASLLFLDMDKMLGKDLEGGLNNLKMILERR